MFPGGGWAAGVKLAREAERGDGGMTDRSAGVTPWVRRLLSSTFSFPFSGFPIHLFVHLFSPFFFTFSAKKVKNVNKKGEKRVNRKARERKASWPRLRMTRHGQNDVLVCNLHLCGRLAWLLSSMIFLMSSVFPGTFFSPIFCLFGFQHSQITFFTSCFSPFSHFLVFLELPQVKLVLWESVRTRKDTQVCKGIERICQNLEAYTSLSQASQALTLRPSEFWEPGPQPMRARAVALADMPPWRPWRRGNQNVVQLRCTSFLDV